MWGITAFPIHQYFWCVGTPIEIRCALSADWISAIISLYSSCASIFYIAHAAIRQVEYLHHVQWGHFGKTNLLWFCTSWRQASSHNLSDEFKWYIYRMTMHQVHNISMNVVRLLQILPLSVSIHSLPPFDPT